MRTIAIAVFAVAFVVAAPLAAGQGPAGGGMNADGGMMGTGSMMTDGGMQGGKKPSHKAKHHKHTGKADGGRDGMMMDGGSMMEQGGMDHGGMDGGMHQ